MPGGDVRRGLGVAALAQSASAAVGPAVAGSGALRHGQPYRPGNHAGAVLVALGTGVMFTLTVYLVQRSLLDRMLESAPPDMPNVFLVNITEAERAGLVDLIREAAGCAAAAHGDRLGGSQADRDQRRVPSGRRHQRRDGRGRRWITRPRTVTWADRLPPNTEVVRGPVVERPARPGEPLVSVAEEEAAGDGGRAGERCWNSTLAGRRSRRAWLRCTAPRRSGPAPASSTSSAPVCWTACPRPTTAACASSRKPWDGFRRPLYERNPTVTVVNIADVLVIVQDVVDQVALVTRFVSAFAILAGAVILASSVAGTRFRRVREVAILKTVGATRRAGGEHLLGRVPDSGRGGRVDGEPAGVRILGDGAQRLFRRRRFSWTRCPIFGHRPDGAGGRGPAGWRAHASWAEAAGSARGE